MSNKSTRSLQGSIDDLIANNISAEEVKLSSSFMEFWDGVIALRKSELENLNRRKSTISSNVETILKCASYFASYETITDYSELTHHHLNRFFDFLKHYKRNVHGGPTLYRYRCIAAFIDAHQEDFTDRYTIENKIQSFSYDPYYDLPAPIDYHDALFKRVPAEDICADALEHFSLFWLEHPIRPDTPFEEVQAIIAMKLHAEMEGGNSNLTLSTHRARVSSFLKSADKALDVDTGLRALAHSKIFHVDRKEAEERKRERGINGDLYPVLLDKLLSFEESGLPLLERKNKPPARAIRRDLLLMLLMLTAGLRTSEALSLRIKDITLSKDQKTYRIFIRDGKGGKQRVTYAPSDVIGRYFEPFARTINPEVHISAIRNGGIGKKQLSRVSLYINTKKILATFGMDYGLHFLRHVYASRISDTSGSIKLAQDALGHASESTTQIYSHASEERLARATLEMR